MVINRRTEKYGCRVLSEWGLMRAPYDDFQKEHREWQKNDSRPARHVGVNGIKSQISGTKVVPRLFNRPSI